MSETAETESVLAKRHQNKDCLGCRTVGGGGLFGMGIYMFIEGRKRPTLMGKNIVQGLAMGIVTQKRFNFHNNKILSIFQVLRH